MAFVFFSDTTHGIRRCMRLAASAATITLLATLSAAVETPPVLGEAGLRDARVPESVPNISGVWQTPGYDRKIKPMDAANPPWQPWTKEEFEKRVAAEVAGNPLYDPTADCLPSGVPRIIAAPYPVEIIQTPQRTVFLHEVQHMFRIVHMNAQHPAKFEPTFMGHSVGHWEGDTLVIDTIGMVKETQIDEAGTLHSDQLHVVERIRKVQDTLEVLFTIDDPKAFTKPWTAVRIWKWRPEIRLLEYICEENNRNASDSNGVLKKF
ncbi:MAG: hypothetical protein ABI885_09260 [Gammaproteobacteria bacterium]